MEKFKFEIPSIERKQEAIEYINEFIKYNSEISGVGSLDKYIDNYEGWLVKLEEYYNIIPNEKLVPAETYFLIRESDNKIIGMLNIRLTLNEHLKHLGGHIGYGIAPQFRGKGYGNEILRLLLNKADEIGIEKVLVTVRLDNIASQAVALANGGVITERTGERILIWINTKK